MSETKNVAKKTVSTKQGALTQSADVIFRPMETKQMQTFTGYMVMFIASAKHGLRLILRRGTATASVYVYPESVQYSGVKTGDVVTILAEQSRSKKDGKMYWNATAVSVEG